MDFLGRVRTFVRVLEVGSLSAAARAEGLSPAAVSRQLNTLEAEVGAQLLRRTTRSFSLTDEGRRFREHAERLLHEAEAALASVRPDRAVSGPVVVSASVTLGVLRLVPRLGPLLEAHPALELKLRLEDHPSELVGEGVDVAVRANLEPPDASGVVALPLSSFRRVLVAAPAYLRRRRTPKTVAELAGHASVLSPVSDDRWGFVERGQALTVRLTPALRVSTLLGVRAAVLAGFGVALLPDFVVEAELAERKLRRLLPEVEIADLHCHAIYRVEARDSARIEAVVGHLRRTL